MSEGEHVPFPEHIPCFGPHNFHTLANAHARSPPHFHTHAMPPSIVRRMDRGHVLLSDGWVARAPAPISAPLRPSPPQFAVQRPGRQGPTGPQRRRGQRRQHYLLASGRGAPHHQLASPHLTPPRHPTLLPTTITLCHTASPASATSDSAIARSHRWLPRVETRPCSMSKPCSCGLMFVVLPLVSASQRGNSHSVRGISFVR